MGNFGKIHSIETMGLVDGPGIRFVVFLKGCRLRCAFCHNPDTWSEDGGESVTPEELLEKVQRYSMYFDRSEGGVTASGGEPLMQMEFMIEFFKLCKKNKINTVLDTAGFGCGNYDQILKYTDLVILDIKHVDEKGYKSIARGEINELYKFIKALNVSEHCNRVWIRHVMVPGITDNIESMDKIVELISERVDLEKFEKFEILPYHTMGVSKYHKLKLDYRLYGVEPMNKEKALEFEKYVNNAIENIR